MNLNKNNSIRFSLTILALAMGIFLLAGCSQNKVVVETPSATNQTPTVVAGTESLGYPQPGYEILGENSPYPAPPLDSTIITPYPEPAGSGSQGSGGGRFIIDVPLLEGATLITGSGPKNTPLGVVDISMNGEIIGNGVIGEDNRFSIQLATPLQANRIIGIQLGIPRESENWSQLWELRGENARSIPGMGYFLDSVITQPKGN